MRIYVVVCLANVAGAAIVAPVKEGCALDVKRLHFKHRFDWVLVRMPRIVDEALFLRARANGYRQGMDALEEAFIDLLPRALCESRANGLFDEIQVQTRGRVVRLKRRGGGYSLVSLEPVAGLDDAQGHGAHEAEALHRFEPHLPTVT